MNRIGSSLKRTVVIVAVIGILTALGAVMKVSATDPLPPPRMNEAQARNDGCQPMERGPKQQVQGIFPHYVSVKHQPGLDPTIPPDIVSIYGTVTGSVITHEDLPLDHDSHDFNFFVAFDSDEDVTRLHSDANPLLIDADQIEDSGVAKNRPVMEMEWETKYFPMQFWPSPGDKVWMVGRNIWDCGHRDPGWKTEIHPPKGVAFTRDEPFDEPGQGIIWNANKTYVYFHGNGGYFYDPVGRQDYTFDIIPPKKTAGSPATLESKIIALPFGGPRPICNPVKVKRGNEEIDVMRVTYPLKDVRETKDRWNLYRAESAVDMPVARPRLNAPKFGAVIVTGYKESPPQPHKRLRVTLEKIRINYNHEKLQLSDREIRLCSGEWHLWISVQGHWLKVPGLAAVTDKQGQNEYVINKSVDIVVPQAGTFWIRSAGWEDDVDGTFGLRTYPFGTNSLADLAPYAVNNNDPIGVLREKVTGPGFNTGGPRSADSKRNHHGDSDLDNKVEHSQGDFTLTYRVEER